MYFYHLSAKESVNLVREAKKRGVRVQAETCGHYLTLTDAKNKGVDGINYLMLSLIHISFDLPNMSAATISYSHAGFIGGVLAGLNTKNNKVAMVTGEFYDTHRMMEASFYKGVAYVNPDIETTAITTGDWADTCLLYPTTTAAASPGLRAA